MSIVNKCIHDPDPCKQYNANNGESTHNGNVKVLNEKDEKNMNHNQNTRTLKFIAQQQQQ